MKAGCRGSNRKTTCFRIWITGTSVERCSGGAALLDLSSDRLNVVSNGDGFHASEAVLLKGVLDVFDDTINFSHRIFARVQNSVEFLDEAGATSGGERFFSKRS